VSESDCPTRPRKREVPPPQAQTGLHRRRAERKLHITFVCTGNICRSPMAEKMFAHEICQRGLRDAVRVTSAGTAGWHVGKSADERANRVLRAHGYPTDHRAAQIGIDHIEADLVVALARNHVWLLQQLGIDADHIRMLRSFDPRSGAYVLDVDDPYYGDHDDFEAVFAAIEASLPGLHNWVDERLAQDGPP
jgi:protein-tyrosine phosphatase